MCNTGQAASGIWSNAFSGGLWSDVSNWGAGPIADGIDSTADFSTLDIAALDIVHLDSTRVIGNLLFGDTVPGSNWTIDNNAIAGNVLTLQTTASAPLITVNNQTATISAVLAGTQGFIKNGAGTLTLATSVDTWSGNATVNAGTLSIQIGQSATAGFVLENGASLTTNQALANGNFITANSGTSNFQGPTGSNSTFNGLFAGNANLNWNFGNGNSVTTVSTSLLANFGGTVSWGANNFGIRLVANSSGTATSASPFATINLGTGASSVFMRGGGNTIVILGGVSGTGANTALGGPSSTGGTHTYIVGSANSDTNYSGRIQTGAAGTGAVSFVKVGTGTMTLTGLSTNTGAYNLNGGTLKLDYSLNPAGVLNATSALNFGGGSLSLLGKSTGATTQILGNVTLTGLGGAALILDTNGGASTALTVGTITAAAAGGSLNITSKGTGVATLSTTSGPLGDGTYGARITYGTDWAGTSSGASPFTLSAYSSYAVAPTIGGVDATNDIVTDSATFSGSLTTNSLKVAATLPGRSLDLGAGILTLTSGGLLFSGAGSYTILNGTISTGTELLVQQLGVGNLSIGAVIASGSLTKAGSGTLTLTGSNTYTGITSFNSGTISISDNANLGLGSAGAQLDFNGGTLQATSSVALESAGASKRNVSILGGGATFDVTGSNTLTIGGIISAFNTQQLGPLIKSGTGTLTLASVNLYGGATRISGGVLSVATLADGGQNSAIGSSANVAPALILDGGTLQYTGALQASNRSFTLSQNGGGFDASGSGALALSNPAPVATTGSGTRSFALSGTNTDANTFAAAIVDGTGGATSLLKSGLGTWILTNPKNSYTGNTAIAGGGKLILASASANSIASSATISIGAGSVLDVSGLASGRLLLTGSQTLAGSGSVLGGITTTAGSRIVPGNGGIGTLTLGSFTMVPGSVYDFEFGSPASNDLINVTVPNGLVISGGGFDLYQDGTLNKWTTAGTYNLFQFSGASGGIGALGQDTILNKQAGLTYQFGVAGNFITLTISGSAALISKWNADANGNWSDATKWSSNPVIPHLAGDTANFTTSLTAPRTILLDANQTVGSITFNSAPNGYTLAAGSGSLTLNNGTINAVVINSGGSHVIGAPVKLSSSAAISVLNSADVLNLSGAISNTAAPMSLIKAGPGTLVLGGANSYGPAAGSIGTTLSAGALRLANNSALGAGDLSIEGTSILQAGIASLAIPNNIILTGGASATVDAGASGLTLSGAIGESGGKGSLLKVGAGALKLTGTGTYTGVTTVSAGALVLGDGGVSGSVAGNIINNGSLLLNRSDSYLFSNLMSGSGSLTQSGLGEVTLVGINTYLGDTVAAAGILTLGDPLSIQNSVVDYNKQGGILSFGGLQAATVAGIKGTQDMALTNSFFGSVALTVGSSNASSTYAGSLSSGSTLTKIGSGNFILSGASIFTGAVGVNAGELQIGVGGALSSATLFANSPGTFRLNGGTLTSSGAVTIGGGASVVIDSGTASFASESITNDAGRLVINGGTVSLGAFSIARSQAAVDFNSGLVINGGNTTAASINLNTSNSWGSLSVTGGSLLITNASGGFLVGSGTNGGRGGALRVSGGTLSYNGTDGMILNNSGTGVQGQAEFSGGVSMLSGIVLNRLAAAGNSTLTLSGGTLYLGAGGIVANTGVATATITLASGLLGASSDWISAASIGLTGNINFQAADPVGFARQITLSGPLSGGGGFTKTGAGTLSLSGAGSSSGIVSVQGGTLKLDYFANPSGVLGSFAPLLMGGGTLLVLGNPAGATTQTLGDLTVAGAGSGRIQIDSNGGASTALNLGALIATAPGGTVAFSSNASGTITAASNPLSDGTYGARFIYGNEWASSISLGAPYTLSAYQGYTPIQTGGGQDVSNSVVTGSVLLGSALVTNSLKIAPGAAGQSLDLNNKLLGLTGGGLLYSSAFDYSILKGTLQSVAATSPDLVIQQLGTGNLTIGAVISNGTGAATLTKAGPGTLTLTSSNSYSGATYLNAGVVSISANANLGAVDAGADLVFNGGTLRATASLALDNAGANKRKITIADGGAIFDVSNSANLTVSGVASGAALSTGGQLVKSGTGTLTLSGVNLYAGATRIAGGAISVNALANGGAPSGIGASSKAASSLVFDGGLLQYTGAARETDRSFTLTQNGGGLDASGAGNAALTFSNAASIAYSGSGLRTLTLTGSSTGNNTLASAIGNGDGGATSLSKSGSGTWVLTGANHTYTGGTALTGSGRLVLQAASANPIAASPIISIGNGATLDVMALTGGVITLGSNQVLTGGGTLNGGAVTVAGTQLSPGTGPGTLALGMLTMAADSVYSFELGSGAVQDMINVTGTNGLVINGGVFDLYKENTFEKLTRTGVYNLFHFTGALGGSGISALTSASIRNPQTGLTYAFGSSGGFVTLTVGGSSALVAKWKTDGNGAWSNAANWDAGVPNLAGHTANFTTVLAAPRTVTLDGSRTVGTISFNSAPNGYTLAQGSGSLVLDNNGSSALIAVAGGTHGIQAPLSLISSTTISVSNSVDSITISGNVAGSSGAIVKTGPGALVLSGANSYGPGAGTAGTTLGGGSLQVESNAALGTGDLLVSANGTTLRPGKSGLVVSNNIVLGSGISTTVDTGANTFTLAGLLNDLLGGGMIRKAGTGTLKITGTGTYTGTTFIDSGTLQLGGGEASGSLTGDIVNNAALVLNRSNAYSLINNISGTGTLTHAGTGNASLFGANTFQGDTVISGTGAILTIENSFALQSSTLDYNRGLVSFGAVSAATFGGLKGSQDIALLNASGFGVALSVGANNKSTIYGGGLNGAGASLTKVGTGTLSLSGVSSYSGNTGVSGGVLQLLAGASINGAALFTTAGSQVLVDGGSATSSLLSTIETGLGFLLKTGAVAFNAGIQTSANDGTLIRIDGGTFSASDVNLRRTQSFTALPAAAAITNGLYVTGGVVSLGTLRVGTGNSSASARVDGGAVSASGQVAIGLTANSRFSVLQVNGGRFESTDPVSGIVLSPVGGNQSELLLTGGVTSAEKITFGAEGIAAGSGTLVVNGGALYVGSGGIAQAADPGFTSTITLAAGTLGAKGDWSSTVPMALPAGNSILIKSATEADVAASITLNAVLSGDGALVKSGAGNLTLAAMNSYKGTTTVTAGTLLVSGSITGSGLIVNANAIVGGSGTITPLAGSLVLIDGTLSPGLENAVGQLAFGLSGSSFVSLGAGSKVNFNIDSATADLVAFGSKPAAGEWLAATGPVTLALGGNIDYRTTYLVFKDAVADGAAGGFSFSTITGYDSANYRASVQQSGNNYALSFAPIPEPGSLLMFLASAGAGLGLGRFRRRI